MSLFGKDQVEGQPQSLSVPAQFAKGTDMSFFSIVSFPFSLLPMIKSKSFETVVMCFSTLGYISASWQRRKRQNSSLGRKGDGNRVIKCFYLPC